jgi:hypothetical protein
VCVDVCESEYCVCSIQVCTWGGLLGFPASLGDVGGAAGRLQLLVCLKLVEASSLRREEVLVLRRRGTE